jgi:Ran GTPase-activating protein (RanGAP) involved in mRNA processing and transport
VRLIANSVMLPDGAPPCLRALRLNSASLGPAGAAELAAALKRSESKSLVTLHVSGNEMGSDGAAALAGAITKLSHTCHLRDLDLSGNEIGAEGWASLAMCFKTTTSITSLDLSCNLGATQGAKALAEVLPTLTTLRRFVVNDCRLGDAGAAILCGAMIHENEDVEEINMAGNDMVDAAGHTLAEALSGKKRLRKVNVSRNSLTQNSLNAVKTVLHDQEQAFAFIDDQ